MTHKTSVQFNYVKKQQHSIRCIIYSGSLN
uniref:Uncharacterized protein n=1 Tax=Anguilla anguilla TaxID=7936 RepID=A0A0E9QDU2_ANGAN